MMSARARKNSCERNAITRRSAISCTLDASTCASGPSPARNRSPSHTKAKYGAKDRSAESTVNACASMTRPLTGLDRRLMASRPASSLCRSCSLVSVMAPPQSIVSDNNDLVIFDGKKRKGRQSMRYFSQPALKNVEMTSVVALSSSTLFAWMIFSERAL